MSTFSDRKREAPGGEQEVKTKRVPKTATRAKTIEILKLEAEKIELEDKLQGVNKKLKELQEIWPEAQSLGGVVDKMGRREFYKVYTSGDEYKLVEGKTGEEAAKKRIKTIEAQAANKEKQAKKKKGEEEDSSSLPAGLGTSLGIRVFKVGEEPMGE